MQEFTGLQYVKIATANAYGLDKENWDVRLEWFDRHAGRLDLMALNAKEPFKYKKAVRAFHDALNQNPTGYLMSLDGTASGLQLYACLTGCLDTARNTNLLPNYDRMCAYRNTAKTMSDIGNKVYSRDLVKDPLMTTFYGSINNPKEIFGDGTDDLVAFYETLNIEFKGAMEAMADIQSSWQPDTSIHQWTLPDGHKAYVPVRESQTEIIEVDSLAGLKFSMTCEVVKAAEYGISLAANIIHSIDGYVCREMIRRAYKQGFRILTVHDEFWASPNRMNQVRRNYIEILAEIARSNLLSDILSEIRGEQVEFQKFSVGLDKLILQAEYPLS
jgi:DNA-directed RNA polymerase